MSEKSAKWITIPDERIRHVWLDSHGGEHFIDPSYYAESGTPIDEETDEDMTYDRTEVREI